MSNDGAPVAWVSLRAPTRPRRLVVFAKIQGLQKRQRGFLAAERDSMRLACFRARAAIEKLATELGLDLGSNPA